MLGAITGDVIGSVYEGTRLAFGCGPLPHDFESPRQIASGMNAITRVGVRVTQ